MTNLNKFFKILVFFGYSLVLSESPKPGIIFVINGTSSSGKSTLISNLMGFLDKKQWAIASLDEIEGPFDSDEEIEENDLLLKKIEGLAKKGKNVLVDTVLLDKDFENFIINLRLGLKVFTIFNYCPIKRTLKNIVVRNEKALTPKASKSDRMNTRDVVQPVSQFWDLVRKRKSSESPEVELLSPSVTKDVERSLSEEYPDYNEKTDTLTPKKLSPEFVDRIASLFTHKLNLDTNEKVSLTPKYNYSLIVINDKEDSVSKVIDFINSKIKETSE